MFSAWLSVARNSLSAATGIAAVCASCALCHGAPALADPTTAQPAMPTTGEPPTSTTGSFFSSLRQAFRQDLNYEVVRGHFDVGTQPGAHRFYCLIDTRSGRKEEYGVGGETFVRPDGMTGIKAGGVSPDSCDKAEQQGILVTTGYVVKLSPKVASNAAAAAPAPAPAANSTAGSAPVASTVAASTAASRTTEVARPGTAADKVDVAGIRLGMTPDQVRAVLKSRTPSDYYESAGAFGAGGRYVNVISAWSNGADPESFEVMFTPVPGKERVMAVVHSAVISGADGAGMLPTALVKKYGGYSAADMPASPTWRIQSDGTVQTGDGCSRRAVVGGLAKAEQSPVPRQNIALKTTPEEFQYQIDHCGIAIITEDQAASASAASGATTRFTVTAYSPSIGFEGAAAATQLMQSAGSGTPRPRSVDSKF